MWGLIKTLLNQCRINYIRTVQFVNKQIIFQSELKLLNVCTNCLKLGQSANICNGKTCRFCCRKHNSILHDPNYKNKHSAQVSKSQVSYF